MADLIDDDDMAAMFHARRVASLEKRAGNRETSTRNLAESGLHFESYNKGAHLIVAGAWDFWPGTGKWCERKGRAGGAKRQGRGVFNLVAIIKKDSDAA